VDNVVLYWAWTFLLIFVLLELSTPFILFVLSHWIDFVYAVFFWTLLCGATAWGNPSSLLVVACDGWILHEFNGFSCSACSWCYMLPGAGPLSPLRLVHPVPCVFSFQMCWCLPGGSKLDARTADSIDLLTHPKPRVQVTSRSQWSTLTNSLWQYLSEACMSCLFKFYLWPPFNLCQILCSVTSKTYRAAYH